MAAIIYSVTLHHLSPGAKAAGLGFPDQQLPVVTEAELAELLLALQDVAAGLTVYEPSTPEIRIKGERETYVVRPRYRRLCLVGRESTQRGEEPGAAAILAEISGRAPPPVAAPRPIERTLTASPMLPRPAPAANVSSGFPEWGKIALLLVLSLGCISGGVWMLTKPPSAIGPKFALLPTAESRALLERAAGEYRTGTAEGDRRLLLSADGTVRLAKFGPARAIAEEIIRTVKGATVNGQTALATTDPYLLIVNNRDTIQLFGQTFTRALP